MAGNRRVPQLYGRATAQLPSLLNCYTHRETQEGERVCPTTMTGGFQPVRISWDQDRETDLLRVDASIPKEVRGLARAEALQAAWLWANPTLPSRGTALVMQLSRIRRRPQNPPTRRETQRGKQSRGLDIDLVVPGSKGDDRPTREPPPPPPPKVFNDHHYAHTDTELRSQGSEGEHGEELSRLCQRAGEVVNEVYGQLMALEPGDWSGREWQKVDNKNVDTLVVSAIDDRLVARWQSLPNDQRTLWNLNCLFYAGRLEGGCVCCLNKTVYPQEPKQ